MRYLLLSVLVVCVIGVMIPSAFATHSNDLSVYCFRDQIPGIGTTWNLIAECKAEASMHEFLSTWGFPLLLAGTVIGILLYVRRLFRRSQKPVAKPKPVKQKLAKKKETSAFCENCGNTLNPKAKFCGSCGTPRA